MLFVDHLCYRREREGSHWSDRLVECELYKLQPLALFTWLHGHWNLYLLHCCPPSICQMASNSNSQSRVRERQKLAEPYLYWGWGCSFRRTVVELPLIEIIDSDITPHKTEPAIHADSPKNREILFAVTIHWQEKYQDWTKSATSKRQKRVIYLWIFCFEIFFLYVVFSGASCEIDAPI